MQDIKLKVPAVDATGAVRHPAEGTITIDDDTAQRWRECDILDEEADHDDLDALTVNDLKATAASEGVDLGAATKKDDIIAAIRAHRVPAQ